METVMLMVSIVSLIMTEHLVSDLVSDLVSYLELKRSNFEYGNYYTYGFYR